MAPALGGSDRRLQRSLPWGIKESSLRSAFWGTPRVVGRPVCGCWNRHYTLKVSNWIPVWVPALLWPRCGSLRVKGASPPDDGGRAGGTLVQCSRPDRSQSWTSLWSCAPSGDGRHTGEALDKGQMDSRLGGLMPFLATDDTL